MDALKKAILERKRAAGSLQSSNSKESKRQEEEESSSDSDNEDLSSSSSGEDVIHHESEGVSSHREGQTSDSMNTETESVSPTKEDSRSNERKEDEFAKSDEGRIYHWINRLLIGWREELDNRPAFEKQTAQGRQNEAAVRECEEKLAPLLRLLETKTLEKNILEHLIGIVHECDNREYRRAFDRYIQLTIGNAPWPIGVTMVGIHARSGREKIAESKVKHLMKDETVRAYMTSFKRLMTRCQTVSPPDAPSKRMN